MSTGHLITQLEAAIRVHKAWCEQLEEAIETSRFKGTRGDIAQDDRCLFGQWLHGPTLAPWVRESTPYAVVSRLHAEFHQSAADVVDLAFCGSKSRARELLHGEFADRSDRLSRALTMWRMQLDSMEAL